MRVVAILYCQCILATKKSTNKKGLFNPFTAQYYNNTIKYPQTAMTNVFKFRRFSKKQETVLVLLHGQLPSIILNPRACLPTANIMDRDVSKELIS